MSSISPVQVRAARAMLGWSMVDLAAAARVSVSTVKRFEDGRGAPDSIGSMRDALEAGGIVFLDDDGGGQGLRCTARRGPQPRP